MAVRDPTIVYKQGCSKNMRLNFQGLVGEYQGLLLMIQILHDPAHRSR